MKKIKILSLVLSLLLLTATSVKAAVLSVQTLPSYINTNNFKLSCTSNGGMVQFYVSKHGGAFTPFGEAIDTDTNPCVVQVNSSVIDEQTDYIFKANDIVQSSSFIYDTSGPSPVSGYYKDTIDSDDFKLHWRNPGDTDFDKVIIYRGETVDFSADNNHEIARVNGSPNSDMTYDEHTPDPNKTYYYALRALDRAGNSSSLVGDGSTTSSSTTTTGASGSVTSATGSRGGSVLGASESVKTLPIESASPSAETNNDQSEAGVSEGSSDSSSSKNWKYVGVGAILLLGVYFILRRMKKI